ncbi:MAG TPA: type IV pilus biogenesis protein PilP [Paraburkholderia sp.]|jgi:type IV pilus biogenesis protein PilP|nr:type IV pilus biogenesis protein PilP [Paraburkholderia sp.]
MSNERAATRRFGDAVALVTARGVARATACWLVALAACGSACAAAAAPDVTVSVDAAPAAAVVPTSAAMAAANQLMRLQEDTVVLNAQLKKLDAQAQVAAREAALNQVSRTVANTEVSVIATQSLGRETSATVRTVDGGELDVHAGDTLPDGMRVVSIRPGAMVVQGVGGQRSTLLVTSVRDASRMAASADPLHGGTPPIPTFPMPTR